MDHGFTVLRFAFIVLGVAATAADPSEGAFDDPAFGKDDEGLCRKPQ